jgi:hypothetical protein
MEPIEIGKHCQVSYCPDYKCVIIEWLDMPSSDEFRKGCDTALELLREKGLQKFLVNNSKAKLFSVSDQRWLNDDWLPRAEKAGYRYSATVLGDSDAFVKFAAHSIANKRDQSKFISKFFKTTQEALEWLSTL